MTFHAGRWGGEWTQLSKCPGVRCGVFFFQAEDGIRDVAVTGVQTCALPISYLRKRAVVGSDRVFAYVWHPDDDGAANALREWVSQTVRKYGSGAAGAKAGGDRKSVG